MSIRWTIPLTGFLILAVLILPSCAGPAPRHPAGVAADAEWARAMKAGRTAFELGNLDLAARFYGAALSRGRTMDSASAIADAAYNLAACRLAQGEHESARALLKEAKAEMSRSHDEPDDVLLVEAQVMWLLGEPEQAISLTEKLLGSAQTKSKEGLQAQARLLRGKIACAKGDKERAIAELQSAEKIGGEESSPAVNAGRSELAGCISLLQGNTARAAQQFDREANSLREAGQYRKMADALNRAGDAYHRESLEGEAADRWFRAARTIFTLGDSPQARDLATKALGAAEEVKDKNLMERTRSLLEEIQAADTDR
jgi:tetratricopeptide (TPR) repeat protein